MTMEDAVYYGEENLGRPGRSRDNYDPDGNCCTKCCKKCCACFRASLVTLLIFIFTGAGIAVGGVLRFLPPFDQPKLNPRPMMYMFYVTELTMRFMQFIVVPLVVSSLISGLGALHSTSSGKVGLRTMAYYLCTTIIAVGEGVGFIYAIRPGVRGPVPQLPALTQAPPEDINKIDAFLDIFRNMIPDNFVKIGFEMVQSKTVLVNVTGTNGTTMIEKPILGTTPNINIIGITFYSIVFGVALSRLGSKGKMVFMFFDGLFEACLTVMKGMIWLYPIGIFFVMVHTVIILEDPLNQLKSIFIFILTVLLGLFTHACLILPILFVVFTRRNPFRHLYGCFRAIVTGFATNNSNMTLPVTMECLEGLGISKKVVRFVCPIGSTMNMDGLALYEAMACIYVATLRGMTLTAVQIVAMFFTAVAVSIGAPAMGGGLATFIMLFSTVGLPLQDIFILLPFDWMLARFRTIVNLWGDCVGAAVIEKCSRADLNRMVHAETDDLDAMDQGHPDGAVLTGYMPRQPRDWTVRLVNERGDKLVVSKV